MEFLPKNSGLYRQVFSIENQSTAVRLLSKTNCIQQLVIRLLVIEFF